MELDWNRRYRLMRLHFAAELVNQLLRRELGGERKTGAHISENRARLDSELSQMNSVTKFCRSTA